MTSFNTDIQFLKGVGQKRAEILRSRGIDTIGALLRYYPRDYIDFSKISAIDECPFNENVCVKAKLITNVNEDYKRPGMILYNFIVNDGISSMSITLFNQKYLAATLAKGSEYLFYGKVGGSYIMRCMNSPDVMKTSNTGIHPVYRTIKGISSKCIQKLVKNALTVKLWEDVIPESVIADNHLCKLETAIKNIHFPCSQKELALSKERLVFDELFVLQVALIKLKSNNKSKTSVVIKNNTYNEFLRLMPFELTNAQKRAICECTNDIMSGTVMNRLVQGDVGSGKTAIAAALCYLLTKNGYQTGFMAPTEVLAEQHYHTLQSIFKNSNVNIALLTGSSTKKEKAEVKCSLLNGKTDIVVGTHALITDDVGFFNLGLVITDEQHRFGVSQRACLSSKGNMPHTLVMSATPIPRTLSLIVYGDLDISIVDEYPRGRQKVTTYVVDSSYHKRIFSYVKKFLNDGKQAFIVCPLVEENEDLDLKSAKELYDNLRNDEFKNYSLGLLHGKMNSKSKEKAMNEFKDGKIQLLISTTVIEVGIDVPNAVVMIIENAERFGLSQLHQLRGRIGRGKDSATCILVSDFHTERLNIIKNNNDGFKIADEDLKLRGPGDFLGNRQHGLPEFKIADIYSNSHMLRIAGLAAQNLLKNDPNLIKEENANLKNEIDQLYKNVIQN